MQQARPDLLPPMFPAQNSSIRQTLAATAATPVTPAPAQPVQPTQPVQSAQPMQPMQRIPVASPAPTRSARRGRMGFARFPEGLSECLEPASHGGVFGRVKYQTFRRR